MADYERGYDANFVENVNDLFKCGVCFLVMKEPVQVIECGHKFCKTCYEHLKIHSLNSGSELLCPLDRTLVNDKEVFPDKGIERKIQDLQVKCDHFDRGCNWINELRCLQGHLDEECVFQIIACPNDGCTEKVTRNELKGHEQTCTKREVNQGLKIKKLESLVNQLTERLSICENQMQESYRLIANLNGQIVSLKFPTKTKLVGYYQWNITDYTRKCSKGRIGSCPFVTLNGYNCLLHAEWTGKEKTQFGLFFGLLVGERDDDLVWPFNMKVTFECCSMDNEKRVHSLDRSTANDYTWGERPTKRSGGKGWGFPKFLSQPDIHKFIINNAIVINCYIETIN